MTYPPSGGTPDPYQPAQPYGQSSDPTTPYNAAPDPISGQPGGYPPPSSGQPYAPPTSGQPYPPAYGQQPYGQQAYGQPGPYGQPVYVQTPGTNTMAILALVFAFIFAPASIVLGHIAKKQIRQSGEQGDGLATAGLWLGYIFTSLYVLLCAGWLALVVFAANSSSTY